jgi:membrane-bound ClpP family serine protease
MDPLIIAIGLYFVAILLAVIDIFVPSGGILLVLSAIAAVGAIVFGFRIGATTGLLVSVAVLATIPTFVYSAIKFWPHTPIGRRILLAPPEALDTTTQDRLSSLVGLVVIAPWPIAPMGQVKIGTQRYSAKSFGSKLIDAGQRIKIVDVHEGILVVEPSNEPLSESIDPRRSHPAAIDSQAPVDQDLLQIPAKQLGLSDLDELPLEEER